MSIRAYIRYPDPDDPGHYEITALQFHQALDGRAVRGDVLSRTEAKVWEMVPVPNWHEDRNDEPV